jgi:membrane-associated phospholipid phosphatase
MAQEGLAGGARLMSSTGIEGGASRRAAMRLAVPASLRAWFVRSRAEGLDPSLLRVTDRLWLLVAALFGAQWLVLPFTGLHHNQTRALIFLTFGLFLLVISRVLLRGAREPFLGHFAGGIGLAMLVNVGMLIWTFVAVSLGFPFQDAALDRIDRWLGFDYVAMAQAIIARPALTEALTLAYQSIKPQMFLIVAVLCLFGRFRALALLSLAWALSLIVVVVLFALVPAQGAFHHYGLMDLMKATLSDPTGYIFVPAIEAARSGVGFSPYDSMIGIVSFPSFHATAGLLYIWAFWQVRPLRYPMLALNLAMIAATPLLGAHYLIDILAGIAIGFAAIAVARRLVLTREQRAACGYWSDRPASIQGG